MTDIKQMSLGRQLGPQVDRGDPLTEAWVRIRSAKALESRPRMEPRRTLITDMCQFDAGLWSHVGRT